MTTQAEAKQAILSHFIREVGTADPNLLYSFDNEIQNPLPEGNFCRFVPRVISGSIESFGGVGSRTFQRRGLAVATIYTAKGSGVAESDRIANIIQNAFEGQQVNNVVINSVGVADVGQLADRYQSDVNIEFSFYDRK